MTPRIAFGLALAGLTAGALALRLPALDIRPMHCDEAVHALKFQELWETGRYEYDPNEFHGPTLHYATLPVAWLSGIRDFVDLTEVHFRLAPAILGGLMVLLLAPFAYGLGRWAVLWSGLALALSPAFGFYSRYYIQEMLLAFLTLGLLGAGWRYVQTRKVGWALTAGLCAGLMAATKETAVLTFLAMGLAAVPLIRRRRGAEIAVAPALQGTELKHSIAAVLVATAVACVFLSGFFTHVEGPVDYLKSYATWGHRAGATEVHQQPWYYYLSLIAYQDRGEGRGPIWTEAMILALAAVGMIAAVAGPKWPLPEVSVGLLRLIALYTIILTALYSAIPYKTPWCVLSPMLGMVLLSGVGAYAVIGRASPWPRKLLMGAAVLTGAVHLGYLSYETSYVYTTSGRNPYAYAQTVPDIVKLEKRAEELAAVAPQGFDTVVQVLSSDAYYYPLPWYLRRFANVGYWVGLPEQEVYAPIVLASSSTDSPQLVRALRKRISETHLMTGMFGMRPDALVQLWVEKGLWDKFMETRA